MKKSDAIISILSAKHVGQYSLAVKFSDGKEQVIDLGPFLEGSQHPEIRKYLKPAQFKKFRLDGGELMWGDFDLIFPVMDLYDNCIASSRAKTPAKQAI